MNILNLKGRITTKPRLIYKKTNQLKGAVTIEEFESKKKFQIILWNNIAKELIENSDVDDILSITAKLDSRVSTDRNGGVFYNLTIHAKSYEIKYAVLK